MSDNTYWNSTGNHQELGDKLRDLIPAEGPVERPHVNRALEKFRKASNCYYDLYNNGLCNRAQEFAKVFGIASSHYKEPWRGYGCYSRLLYIEVEAKMDEIILAAAVEQGIALTA